MGEVGVVIVPTAGPVAGLVAPEVRGGVLRPLSWSLNGALAQLLLSVGHRLLVVRLDVWRHLAGGGREAGVAPALLVLVVVGVLHLVGAGPGAGLAQLGSEGRDVLLPGLCVPPHLARAHTVGLGLPGVVLLLGVTTGVLGPHLHAGVPAVGVEGGGVHAVVHVVQRGVEVGHHLGVRRRESR